MKVQFGLLKSTLGAVAMIGGIAITNTIQAAPQTMIVAGGCFWCVESDFEKVEGVTKAVSGYIGGHLDNPTYKQVARGKTGHFEAVEITFDDEVVSLDTLAHYFWRTIDPTDAYGQFCDKGAPYKTAMFYQDEAQKSVFEASLAEANETKPFKADIVTEILPADTFYLAEEYHQDYYKKSPVRYGFYRSSCRRDSRIESLWGSVASKEHH
ncbi:peptide-methionine (S)-S-oxide reductase MsrA [Marinomonas sp. C2222]|uniref:Peptide methionine sulfoxide reductase MsrA n=1 Tax=Marinomonas sargassi TaxID=2984494 RepID=A0ABT2YVM4_9GAMM|nr:peptide-methionine (S)-S-oxide reductase MsrA [Marinomonas sargassi]MCV2403634.1 peptide-methionine (S)-S-oxide reductase MsrA [Marinomonas sargassi]